ncbi:TPA: LysR family transcriptional regulator [Burkholderia cenocepacia]|uniref:LysR family transcriptional regulator n=1 Tax=Burkholderia sp. BCC0801 TaxID=2676291 RepID=UPI001588C1A3|nr:LysR family transcriptional regulator [Burkholderia sp. BCC0801]MCO2385753.1 LysR family transcriptional regulator [Pseudomonas aeruginosa]HEF5874272.1 LysR family transcriptional regulator [Burkholderia cenocepacia]
MNGRQWGMPTALCSRIPLASLIHTLAVAEYLSFYRAAQALGTTQSSVSARIKALETELGILLFERNTRGVRLTEAGRLFVERVSAGIEHLDHAVKSAGMAALGECGRLRMGVHGLIPHSFLANLIGRYRDDYPGIDIEITEGTAREAVMQLRADRLDVAFVAGAPGLPDCHTRPIWTEPLMAVLPQNHRLAGQSAITWSDLVSETFLVRQGGTGPQVHDHIVLRLAGRWPAPSILRFDVGRGTLLSMVGQGFGVTIVGAATALLPTSAIVFIPIADEPEPVAFTAVWLPANRNAALQNLLRLAGKLKRSGYSAVLSQEIQ